jgi:hypothetical protein
MLRLKMHSNFPHTLECELRLLKIHSNLPYTSGRGYLFADFLFVTYVNLNSRFEVSCSIYIMKQIRLLKAAQKASMMYTEQLITLSWYDCVTIIIHFEQPLFTLEIMMKIRMCFEPKHKNSEYLLKFKERIL